MGGDLCYSTALCPASSLDPGQMGREQFLTILWRDFGGLEGQRQIQELIGCRVVFGRVDTRKKSRGALFPPSFGTNASNGHRKEGGTAAGVSW